MTQRSTRHIRLSFVHSRSSSPCFFYSYTTIIAHSSKPLLETLVWIIIYYLWSRRPYSNIAINSNKLGSYQWYTWCFVGIPKLGYVGRTVTYGPSPQKGLEWENFVEHDMCTALVCRLKLQRAKQKELLSLCMMGIQVLLFSKFLISDQSPHLPMFLQGCKISLYPDIFSIRKNPGVWVTRDEPLTPDVKFRTDGMF